MLTKPDYRKMSTIPFTVEVKLITPTMAKYMREHCLFDRQRKLRPENIERLLNEMIAGRFIPGTMIKLGKLPDESERLINGNHTLEAIMQYGKGVLLTLAIYKCLDEDEIGRIYAVEDIHKTRTWYDSLRGMGKEESMPLAGRVIPAIAMIDYAFVPSNTAGSRIERIDRMDKFKEPAELFHAAIHGGAMDAVKLCKTAPVMGVALITLRDQPSEAVKFWNAVAHDDGLKKGNPAKALLSYMRGTPAMATAGRTLRAKAAALAWNSAFHGKEIDYIQPGKMKNLTVAGTRWSKGAPDEGER